MRAYAILDGGGVKGAALAGCLLAAEERGIQFLGYGGTSAGSIIALLACVGYSGDELREIATEEIQLTDFLDDGGLALDDLKQLPNDLATSRWKSRILWKYRNLFYRIHRDLGLYRAHKLGEFLLAKIGKKLKPLKGKVDVTFEDLKRQGCPELKIVASDLALREPRVFSGGGGAETNGSVIDAVRASMSYPFVFCPVQMNERFLVDGGLSSNLPVYLFEKERRKDSVPIIAFDLVSSRSNQRSSYGLSQFCSDMLATALESGDYLMRSVLDGIHHVPVPIPSGIDTLDLARRRSAASEPLRPLGLVRRDRRFEVQRPSLPCVTATVCQSVNAFELKAVDATQSHK